MLTAETMTAAYDGSKVGGGVHECALQRTDNMGSCEWVSQDSSASGQAGPCASESGQGRAHKSGHASDSTIGSLRK